MKILGNTILIEPTEPFDKLPSGLFLPQTAIEKPNTGTVLVVGKNGDKELIGKKVMYNPIIATNIYGKHLLHITDIKMIL